MQTNLPNAIVDLSKRPSEKLFCYYFRTNISPDLRIKEIFYL